MVITSSPNLVATSHILINDVLSQEDKDKEGELYTRPKIRT